MRSNSETYPVSQSKVAMNDMHDIETYWHFEFFINSKYVV